jgi:Protein of unknown function (DUF998)
MTATTTPTATSTANRLTALAVAGPLWVVVSVAQVVTRDGFDITRHPLSLLSTGALGWLQIANFVVAGALIVAGATGLRRVLSGRPGGTWAPRLVRTAGLGLIAAGVLVMDPADGFPVGTPAGVPASMSWHSIGHMVAGTITFAGLIAACYVLARHFAAAGSRGLAVAGAVSGTALLAGWGWAMSGGPAGSLTLAIGAIAAMVFVSLTAAVYRR